MSESFRIARREGAPISDEFSSIDPILAHVLAHRGLSSASECCLQTSDLLPFDSLKDIDKAVKLLVQTIESDGKILIVGDYDADGATSTALLMRAFKQLRYPHIDYLIPNRFDDGYGLSASIVQKIVEQAPDLLITVDNGISSIEGVAVAKQAGIKVLITDHHLPGEQLPDADAIVNPNQPECPFPSKHLAGVGVAFYLMAALRSCLRKQSWFEKQSLPDLNITQLLDLVALGTVADVVRLDKNNRILVQQGINRIRAGKGCVGINALCEVAKRSPSTLVSQDLGFGIAPRLNAAGRIENMGLGIDLLRCEDIEEARRLALELDQLNHIRRDIEQGMRQEAIQMTRRMDLSRHSPMIGVTIYDPDWHEGIIGIVASRIRERINRPVIVMTDSDDRMLRGSGRSISGFNLRDALHEISIEYPKMLQRFGGHAMAAGLTIKPEDLTQFQEAFNRICHKNIDETQLIQHYDSDGELTPDELTVERIAHLKMAYPWGQGFDAPQFDGRFILEQFRWVGGSHLKMTLLWEHSGDTVEAIFFYAADKQYQPETGMVEMVYQADINEWNGLQSIQFRVIAIRNLTRAC